MARPSDIEITEDQFKDIRPYNDDEFPIIIKNLRKEPGIYSGIAKFAFPRFKRYLPPLANILTQKAIENRLKNINNIYKFQAEVTGWFFFRMLRHSATGIEYSCVEPLDRDIGNLFLSNHRDIAVDPALMCYVLMENDMSFPLIGIGDNLLATPQATSMMKLNRSFIVKRTPTSPREMMANMRQLSQFIYSSVHNEHENVWLAQREGRAKDSRDRTSTALIKMLQLHKTPRPSVAEALMPLNIRSVSISYQYDPCVLYKAAELVHDNAEGTDDPSLAHIDEEFLNDPLGIEQLLLGIKGYKGKIRIVVGSRPKWKKDDTVEDVVNFLDKEIISNYELQNSHFYALKKLVELGLHKQDAFDEAVDQFHPSSTDCPYLEKQFSKEPAVQNSRDLYIQCLNIYANPVLEKLSVL